MKRIMLLLLFVLSASIYAQAQHTVSGKVTDDTGIPMPGVAVVVHGETRGVVTGNDGEYQITDIKSANALDFTFIGYATQTIVVGKQKQINITLKSDDKKLDEVVVIGYGTQKKKDVTTSVSTVSSKEWANRPIVSADQALQGKAAGVQVMAPSGKPGEGMTVRVRGATSINAGNDPLYVVDGIPTDNINNLNPNDIESMQVLKDASSAAIYGARGANGVVIITTKRGKEGKLTIQFSTYQGFSRIGKTLQALNTTQFYDLIDEISGSGTADRTNKNYTDWNKETFTTGHTQNYELSSSGGTKNLHYYVSGGYQSIDGIVKPSSYDRYSLRSNIDAQITSKIKMITNINLSRTGKNNVNDNTSTDFGGVILSVLNTPPSMYIWDQDPQYKGQYDHNPYQGSWDNPIARASGYDFTTENRIMFLHGYTIDFLKNLSLKSTISVDYSNVAHDTYLDMIQTNAGRQEHGEASSNNDQYMTWLNENILSYKTSFGKNNFTALAGFTEQSSSHNSLSAYGSDMAQGLNLYPMTVNLANQRNGTSWNERYTMLSALTRVQYNYDSRYLLTANFRSDGSSKLAPGHRWGFFPSVSGGWRISSESFFKPLLKTVNDLKLRASYGITGNENGIGDYEYLGQQATSVGPVNGGLIYTPDQIANTSLTWETTTQYNVGLDLALFNNRIKFTYDAYAKNTTNLLLRVTLPATAAISPPMRNGGAMTNKGMEFGLSTVNLEGKIRWTSNFNLSFNRNMLTKLELTPVYFYEQTRSDQNAVIVKAGLPMGSFFGYVSQGVDPQTGNMKYKDLNGDGVVDTRDRTVLGNAQPKFIYGLTNNISYMNWTLSLFIQGSQGNKIFNASRIDTEGMFDNRNQSVRVLNRWEKVGQITDIPKAGNDINNYANSSRFIEDGSYMRLKSLTLNYAIPQTLLSRVGIASMSAYITANNLLTLTKYSGYDPEVNAASSDASGKSAVLGVDMGTYPQDKSITIGINVSF